MQLLDNESGLRDSKPASMVFEAIVKPEQRKTISFPNHEKT